MTDVTRILSAIGQGNPSAAEQLLPLVYEELQKLAAQKMANEKPGQTLQATALIHEAYTRIAPAGAGSPRQHPPHFFGPSAVSLGIVFCNLSKKLRTIRASRRY